MKPGFKIKTIHAFIAEDQDGTEGIVGTRIGSDWLPFVCADEARIASFRPLAEQIAKGTNKQIKLIKFSVREDLEVIG